MKNSAAIALGHGVVLDPDGWAARLGRALQDARCARDASRRTLAKDSGGRFTARDLRRFELGLRPVGERLSPLLAELYELDLGGIEPLEAGLDVDLDARVIRAGGARRTFEGDDDVVHGALAAYLHLVWAMRGGGRTPVSLRRGDVELLGGALALDEERVVEQLAELMQVSRDDARRIVVHLRRRPLVVPLAIVTVVGVTAGLTLVNGGGELGAPGLRGSASPAAPVIGVRAPSANTSGLADVLLLRAQQSSGGPAALPDGASPASSDAGLPAGPGGPSQPGGAADGQADDTPAIPATGPGGAEAGGDGAAEAGGDPGPVDDDEAAGPSGATPGTNDDGDRAAADTAPSAPSAPSTGAGDAVAPPDGTDLPEQSEGAPDETVADGPSDVAPTPDLPTVDPDVGDPPLDDPPASDPPSGDEPAGDEPAGDEPAGDAPAVDPPSGDPPVDDPPAGDPSSGDKPAGDPPAGDPPTGDPPTGDPPTDDPPAGDPPVDDPPAGDQTSTDPPAGDPPASDPPSDSPPPSDPAPTDPPSGDPSSGGGKGNNGKSEYAPGQGGDGWGAGTGKK